MFRLRPRFSEPTETGSAAEEAELTALAARVDLEPTPTPAFTTLREEIAGCGDVYFSLHQMPLRVEVDEGVQVRTALGDQNAARVLEQTQRHREAREQEKAHYSRADRDLGGPAWGGGSDW